MPWLLHIAVWLLAVASLVTLGQRVHSVRTSPGAMDPVARADSDVSGSAADTQEAGEP